MAFYLTIREGDSPEDSYPIIATADQEIIRLVARGLTRKLAGQSAGLSMLKNAKFAQTPNDGQDDGE